MSWHTLHALPVTVGVLMYVAGLALWVAGPSEHGIWPADFLLLIAATPVMITGIIWMDKHW